MKELINEQTTEQKVKAYLGTDVDEEKLYFYQSVSSTNQTAKEMALKGAPEGCFVIADAQTVAYGQRFMRIMCVTCPAASVTMMVVTVFQATGEKLRPMLVSMLRKGGLDIPFMLLYNALAGVEGIAFATPTADVLTMSIGIILIIPYWKKITALVSGGKE